MDKSYEPGAIESHWYAEWEANNYFAPSGSAEPYTIMLPPPNVTGTLHMGHAFGNAIQDALIRYQRLRGRDALWQAGTDHAGIATQMVVERQLDAEGRSRHDLGRDAFLDRVWQWKQASGDTITRQLRRLGSSLDWQHECFTMDEARSTAVREVFVQLHERGLIYRGKRLVNWDPVLLTAVSDLEVISEEEDGHLWHLRYPLSEPTDAYSHLVVATTRPETMLGDTAVAVNPQDPRFTSLIGKTIDLPLTGRRIPIIGDDYADPEFGSGSVKITPAHDFNDYAVGQRNDLPIINIFTDDAHINDAAPAEYVGLTREAARKKVVTDLESLGLLDKVEPHRLKVPRGDRTGSVIEPYLTDQWYVRAGPLAEKAVEVVENGRIRFIPDNWSKTYFEWMRNIEDWCISRQLWWGHRIPAWYDPHGNIHVGRNEADARARGGVGADVPLRQDEDVLDTWFSSALWPFSTLGWPANDPRVARYYPGQVLVTGHDIIFFWVARMVMMGLEFMDEVPFHDVFITGLVLDGEGNKMSKSKGNILDPIDLIDGIDLESLVAKRTSNLMQPQLAKRIEKDTRRQFPDGIPAFGTDALRFTMCAIATHGVSVNFDVKRIEGYRNFCNKLWNATRFVLMNVEGKDCGADRSAALEPGVAERWIEGRLARTAIALDDALAGYRFDLAAQALYEFAWNEYCDWYVELAKTVLNDEDSSEAAKRATRRTLVATLEHTLRLLHPLMPFITEALWQRVAPLAAPGGETPPASIMLTRLDAPAEAPGSDTAAADIEWLKAVVVAVRSARGELNVKPSQKVPLIVDGADAADMARFGRFAGALGALCGVQSAVALEAEAEPPEAALALAGRMRLYIPLAGLIDPAAERERLGRELAKVVKDLDRVTAKLGNASFVERAPPEVVAKERERETDLAADRAQIEARIARLPG